MKTIALLLATMSLKLLAQTPTAFKDDVVLISSKCHAITVEMSSGKLSSLETESVVTVCYRTKKQFSVLCSFSDSKGKTFEEVTMTGAMLGSEGVISSHRGPIDSFLMNAVTNKFYYEGTTRMDDGRIQFKKVCAGNWVYKTDLDKAMSKKK